MKIENRTVWVPIKQSNGVIVEFAVDPCSEDFDSQMMDERQHGKQPYAHYELSDNEENYNASGKLTQKQKLGKLVDRKC